MQCAVQLILMIFHLAAEDVDICAPVFDGDAADPDAQSKLDFSKNICFPEF